MESYDDFPPNTHGFVYKIKHFPTGKSYIGKKVLIHHRKVKVTKKDLLMYEGVKGRKPSYKRVSKESDWKAYYGSNQPLLELVKSETKDNFERTIIKLSPNKKLLTYYETQYLFLYQVLENQDKWFNSNILGKFFQGDFDPQ